MIEISIFFGIFQCKFMEISAKQYGIVSHGIFLTRFPKNFGGISSGTQTAKHHFIPANQLRERFHGFVLANQQLRERFHGFLEFPTNSQQANRE